MLFWSITVNVAHVKSRHSAKKRFTPFEGFVDQHPRLADIVEDLTFSSPDSWRTLSMSFVAAILPKLPRLRCLSLRSVTLEDGPSPAYPVRVPRLRALRLATDSGGKYPLNVLFNHVAADLFEYLGSGQWSASQASCSIDKQPVQRLEIYHDAVKPPDFAFLSTYIAPESLRSFAIEPDEWEGIQGTCGLFRAVGQGLQTIELDLVLLIRVDQSRSSGNPKLDWTVLGSVFSTLSQLESVSVRLPACRSSYYRRPDDFEARYAIFPGIFASEHPLPPSLRALVIRMVGRA
ncbi:hypothetical protein C8Q80DRAFT_1265909 [Daedaleopsis nitida]|nr:hypothetical protein C8Q80DRAFT_1265909 [Daedaleopsis nitida]